jgi:NAD(P)H-dependent nitrite reductase small subunit
MGEPAWRRVAALSDLREAEPLAAQHGNLQLALCRIENDVYAFEDICPHAYALLSQGFVEGGEIECPLHGARFDIASGRCLAPPADQDLRTFPVRIEANDVYVRLEEN